MATVDMQQRNEQTLTDIQGLQTTEQDLFNQLNQPTLTPEQKNSIIIKINEISQMRINLYNNLNSVYSFFGENVASSNAALAEQTIAIGIVEQQLNDAKKKLSEIQETANDNMRMVEINTYYGDKYNNYTNILKLVILFCIPVLFFAVLNRAEIVPDGIYNFIIIVLLVFAAIMIGFKILDASHRSKMNYDEYTWGFDKNTAPSINKTVSSSTTDPWGTATSVDCLGQNCCYQGTIYNSSLNKCVPESYSTTTQTAGSSNSESSSSSGSNSSSRSGSYGIVQGGFGGL